MTQAALLPQIEKKRNQSFEIGGGVSRNALDALTTPSLVDLPPSVRAGIGQGHRAEILRVTPAAVTYDPSPTSSRRLEELCTAINANIQRDDITFRDIETGQSMRVGDLYAIAMVDSGEIVVRHRETAGKGLAGRLLTSLNYVVRNPLSTALMKSGFTADIEDVNLQQFIQFVSQLDREGQFLGASGNRTFRVDDYDWKTTGPWRDIIIKPKSKDSEAQDLAELSMPPRH